MVTGFIVTKPSINLVTTGDPTLEEHATVAGAAQACVSEQHADSGRDEYLPDTQIEEIAAWVVGQHLSVHRD